MILPELKYVLVPKADVTVKISPDLSPDQVADKVGKNVLLYVCTVHVYVVCMYDCKFRAHLLYT